MERLLVIDQDRAAAERFGLACLKKNAGLIIAENLCEAVRALLNETVSMIVIDAGAFRLAPREHATLFERVAPSVPVVVLVRPDTRLETRVAFELAGFRVISRPVTPEDLLEKIVVA